MKVTSRFCYWWATRWSGWRMTPEIKRFPRPARMRNIVRRADQVGRAMKFHRYCLRIGDHLESEDRRCWVYRGSSGCQLIVYKKPLDNLLLSRLIRVQPMRPWNPYEPTALGE